MNSIIDNAFKFVGKQELKTFNETGKLINPLRQKLVEYYKSHSKGKEKMYTINYYDSKRKQYYNINLNNIEIKADTKLACVIIFNDYLNANLKVKFPLDSYAIYDVLINCIEDNCIVDKILEVINLDVINLDKYFKLKNIDKIINDFVESFFTNNTLWFEEEDVEKIHLCLSNDMKNEDNDHNELS